MTDNPNNDLFIDEIYPKKHDFPEVKVLEEQKWKPWHKPRKQWLRENQWAREIKALAKELRLDDRPLRYLSLPGDDLLDFRIIAELCQTKNIRVKLVGFNDLKSSYNSQEKIAVAKNEVFSYEVVVENSNIHHDDFNKISDINSVAYKFANEKGPYDVINLDLCDSFSGVKTTASYYNSTMRLIIFRHNDRLSLGYFC